jgi:hypothetical protein
MRVQRAQRVAFMPQILTVLQIGDLERRSKGEERLREIAAPSTLFEHKVRGAVEEVTDIITSQCVWIDWCLLGRFGVFGGIADW